MANAVLQIYSIVSKSFQTAILQLVNFVSFIGQGVILDRSIYSDLVFTNVIFQDRHISKDGMKIMNSYFYYRTMK